MDTNHAPTPEDLPPAFDHPDFPQWLCRRVGASLKRRRDELNKTAMGLAGEKQGHLSDQTILNNEGGRRNPGIVTLARHSQMLGTSLPDIIEEVMGGLRPPQA